MIIETTYTSQENENLINEKVGKSYTFFQSIKLNGIGSKRMIIESVSPNFNHLLNEVSDIDYANIELRPKGILLHINKGLRTFSWIIPFYHLVIYKINGSSIHAQGHFIRFRNSKFFKENKYYFDKLLGEKVKYDSKYSFEPHLWI